MYTPTKLLVTLIVAVFSAELLIMSVLTLLQLLPQWLTNFLDAFLLVVLVFPILYFRVFRPLIKLNIELEARTTEAESANRAKSAFMANISHEIRTPLHVLIGLGHLLRRAPDQPVPLQRLDQLCATSDHLLALVNDILDLSKIEADKFVLDDSVFRLAGVIDQVQDVIGQLAISKNLTLTTVISEEVRNMTLHGDALRLSQILINLGGNAVKFSDQGRICIGVKIVEEGDTIVCLRFSVQDNGIGIAEEDQVRIFEPFEQIDSSTTRNYGGTGLGLAICKRLVSMMGGTILVESQPGMGSTFSFDITLLRGHSNIEFTSNLAIAPKLAGLRILVAEDHPLSQEIILEMLETLGCITDIAGNGAEAIECAMAHDYDLIMMDIQMPVTDGLAATRAIRALPGTRHIPIIALTANAFVEDRQRCLDAGMNDHICKPVTSAKLAATLGKWLPDMVFPCEEDEHCECELSFALAKIPGLDVASSWSRSPERLVDYCVLLRKFLTTHGRDVAQLKAHLAAGERYAAHAIVHNLKGIAGMIGAKRIESIANKMVAVLRSGLDLDSIVEMGRECEAEMVRLNFAVQILPQSAESISK